MNKGSPADFVVPDSNSHLTRTVSEYVRSGRGPTVYNARPAGRGDDLAGRQNLLVTETVRRARSGWN